MWLYFELLFWILRTNAPYLESSEQLDRFFPACLYKIKLHIFQNISKCLIHGLRPFKYKNTGELCDNIPDKIKERYINGGEMFSPHEEL